MQEFLQQLINGLSAGAIYALIAVGYTMVYGVLRLINFAHGDVYMIGAMTGLYVATGRLDLSSVAWWANPLTYLLVWAGLYALLRALRLANVPAFVAIGQLLAAVSFAAVTCHLAVRAVRALGLPSVPSFLFILLAAMAACAALGYTVELLAYRPLRNQPRITALITAIGISLLLEFGGQRVFGATPQALPPILPGLEQSPELLKLFGASVTKVDVLIFSVTLVLMGALYFLVQHTRTGMALRALSFRFDTASLMGIDVNRIISFTFVLGSTLAAAAGVLVALKYPKVDPLMGLMPGIKAFIAAVLGGIGNIPGAVAGGLLLGLVETLAAGYLPQGSQYRDGIAFVILIAVLLVKPSGLFGRNTIEKV